MFFPSNFERRQFQAAPHLYLERCVVTEHPETDFIRTFIPAFYIFICIQPWCSTQVDSDAKVIKGKWGYCGPDCPTEDDIWPTDDTLTVTPTDEDS